jgi:hypothetical protein
MAIQSILVNSSLNLRYKNSIDEADVSVAIHN